MSWSLGQGPSSQRSGEEFEKISRGGADGAGLPGAAADGVGANEMDRQRDVTEKEVEYCDTCYGPN
jgi:hypothetical protein